MNEPTDLEDGERGGGGGGGLVTNDASRRLGRDWSELHRLRGWLSFFKTAHYFKYFYVVSVGLAQIIGHKASYGDHQITDKASCTLFQSCAITNSHKASLPSNVSLKITNLIKLMS